MISNPKKGHRSILLPPNIGTTVERIIEKKLRRSVRDKFFPSKFGYIDSYSTSHALIC